ncbi:MAG: hypothetical protein ACRC78_21690 [Planktothrix sp.]
MIGMRGVKAQRTSILPKTRITEPIQNSPFWTAQELAIWRSRYISGPFKTAGDYKSNSPNEGEYIDNRIGLATLTSEIYQCFPAVTVTAIPTCSNSDPGLPNKFSFLHYGLKYLLTKNGALGAMCRSFWISQIAETSCDFGNTTRFASGVWDDGAPVRQIAGWGMQLIQFYQYTYDLYTVSERQLTQEFFFKMGVFWMDRNFMYDMIQNNFDVFGDEVYTIKASLNTTELQGYTHLAGNLVYRPMIFNNRRALVAELVGSIGVMLTYFGHTIRASSVALADTNAVNAKITEMINNATYYTKAQVIFGVFPDKMYVDSLRGAEDALDVIGRDLGTPIVLNEAQFDDSFGYPIVALGCALRYEAQKLRAGLTHLGSWQTDKIYNAAAKTVTVSPGVVKSLKTWADNLVDIYNEVAPVRHSRNYSVAPAVNSNSLMKGKNAVTGQKYFRHLHYLAEFNYLHWRDDNINTTVKGDGTFGFPPEAQCFNSGSEKSYTGPHNQTDVTGFKWVGIW